ncbi:MAG: acetyl-CoA carboxylase biotin carboxyl carrier protein subunit [Clostridia bacterium]|nr:acetyl-CoA carboxylase biotin carboxyl carrier protein subunit [Clostridia bacterium]
MRKFNITVNGKTYEVDVEEVGGVQAPVSAPAAAPAAPAPAAKPAAPATPKSAPVAGAKQVTAPMPGTIVSVKVNVGDTVKADTLVAVLEAMKMENEIFAGVEGTVAGISVSAGDSVNSGDVIVSVN